MMEPHEYAIAIPVSMKPEFIKKIDDARGSTTRSQFIRESVLMRIERTA